MNTRTTSEASSRDHTSPPTLSNTKHLIFPRTTAKLRAQRATLSNNKIVATGRFVFRHDEDRNVIYGFENLSVWLPTVKKHIPLAPNDPDKFLVAAEDYETAKCEFFARWRIYCSRRFRNDYIKIESYS